MSGFEQLAELKRQLQEARKAAGQEARDERPRRPQQRKSGQDAHGKPAREAGADGSTPAPAATDASGDTAARGGGRPGEQRGRGGRADTRRGPSRQGSQHGSQQASQQNSPRTTATARAAPREPVDPVVVTIGRLQKRFPKAFPKSPAPKLPLKLGVHRELYAQSTELGLSEAELKEAIKTWCRGSRYWACLVEGATRIGLDGEPSGTVLPAEAARARSLASHRGGPRRGKNRDDDTAAAGKKTSSAAETTVAPAAEMTGNAEAADPQAAAQGAGSPTHAAAATDATPDRAAALPAAEHADQTPGTLPDAAPGDSDSTLPRAIPTERSAEPQDAEDASR